MTRKLAPDSNIETIKKDAKRWLKALRAGDDAARRRLHQATPAAPAAPTLRDVHLALAREYGLPGWSALKQALDELADARRSHAERVAIVLRAAWNGDPAAAARILTRWPEIGADNIHAAAAAGNLDEVRRRLAADPDAAKRKGGPLGWEPLLYLAYARLPGGDADAVEIASLLLDHGADPNARFSDDWDNPFTVLTGVIGEGEGDKAPHPRAREIALLLIERGANPYDSQALYNTSITRDDTRWLNFLWEQSERLGRLAQWRDAQGIGGNVVLSALDYLLGNAIAFNHLRRAEWLVTHGADPDGIHAYSKRPLREEALIHGNVAMAEMLVRHGAAPKPLEGQAAFQAACMELDLETARALARQNPECLRDAQPMLIAARAGRADVVALLLDLGMDVDVADDTQQRGLHNAVTGNAIDVVKLLVAHGADIDRPTTRFGGAVGFAAEFGRREIADFLAPLSRDVMNLTYLGMADRLRVLFAAEPALVNAASPKSGATPLFALPDNEEAAAEMVALLLEYGADPSVRAKDGITAEQAARQRGLIDAADLMAAHGE